jgi:phage portal protein BeeE
LRNYQSWVYAAVNAIAQEVARQRPFIYLNTGQAEHEQNPLPHTHPLIRLLDHPNPWMTPWELWYLGPLFGIDRQCYWYAPRANGLPGELWIIPTPWIRIIPDPVQFVKGYEVNVPGMPTEVFAADEIIHLKYPNPLDVHYGLSPLQANALTIDANTELQKSRYQTFLSGQRPGMVLQTEQMLTDQTIRRIEDKVQSRFGGGVDACSCSGQGLSASPWTLTPAVDYLNSSKLVATDLRVVRVPTPIAGIVENMSLGGTSGTTLVMFCEGPS